MPPQDRQPQEEPCIKYLKRISTLLKTSGKIINIYMNMQKISDTFFGDADGEVNGEIDRR